MKYLLTLLWLLGAIAAQAQEYTGHVADKEDGAPVAGAIVTARDSLGKPLGYTTTSASGDFVLRPRGGGTTAQLDFSTMGYRRQSIPADAGRMLVLLTPEATGIREVTIRAPRLSFRGDTVSYNVSRFTEAQDRSIADVLRKMPGIEVA
ncbi:carboxypeptidase-like regulatory domain-containing protein [Alistipes onderdonkii]|nr:carboxypeptidase-like regulatory domain-containing protein [Alistipes onderdonkii]